MSIYNHSKYKLFNTKQIKVFIKRKKITNIELGKAIGMDQRSIGNIFRYNSIKVRVLEKISEHLKVPITYWFETNEEKKQMIEEGKIGYGKDVVNREDYEFMKSQIKIKDKQILYLQSLGQEEASNKQTGTYE